MLTQEEDVEDSCVERAGLDDREDRPPYRP